MAWKKIILSGSVAELNRAVITNDVVASSINAGTLAGTVNADNGVVSGSSQVTLTDVTGYTTYSSSVSASIAAKPSDWESLENKPSGIVSSSAQTVANLAGQDVEALTVTASFKGDGSGLTNLTVAQSATVVEDFTNQTSYTVTHNFGSKNVLVTVYDSNDYQIFPASIQADTDNTATITFDVATTGTVIVGQGGHIVSGSVPFDSILNKPTLVSGSSQIVIQNTTGFDELQTNISASFAVSSSAHSQREALITDLSGSAHTQREALITDLSGSAHTARASLASTVTVSGSDSTYGTTNLKTQALTITGTANEIETSVSGQTVTVGIVSNPTLTGNVTITGDLNVTGDTIQAQVSNLNVEDRFILLNSGSNTGDSGIIFGGSDGTADEGSGIFWDSPANVFGFSQGIASDDTSATNISKLGNIQTSTSTPSGAPTFQGVGTVHVNTSDEGIWIYS